MYRQQMACAAARRGFERHGRGNDAAVDELADAIRLGVKGRLLGAGHRINDPATGMSRATLPYSESGCAGEVAVGKGITGFARLFSRRLSSSSAAFTISALGNRSRRQLENAKKSRRSMTPDADDANVNQPATAIVHPRRVCTASGWGQSLMDRSVGLALFASAQLDDRRALAGGEISGCDTGMLVSGQPFVAEAT
jgi:hypothetical protein